MFLGFCRRWAGLDGCEGGIVVEVEDCCCWSGIEGVGVGEGMVG